jgi:hypothetical protein
MATGGLPHRLTCRRFGHSSESFVETWAFAYTNLRSSCSVGGALSNVVRAPFGLTFENQLAHNAKRHSTLIRFCHLSSLPDNPQKPHHRTPGFFRSPSPTPFRSASILVL